MNEQPEALRLADELAIQDQCDFHKVCEKAAAELRWLHEENERLRKVPKWFHCDTHGQGNLNAWGCPECVRELRNENERLRDAVKAEREACAKLCDENGDKWADGNDEWRNGQATASYYCAIAIRARGEA